MMGLSALMAYLFEQGMGMSWRSSSRCRGALGGLFSSFFVAVWGCLAGDTLATYIGFRGRRGCGGGPLDGGFRSGSTTWVSRACGLTSPSSSICWRWKIILLHLTGFGGTPTHRKQRAGRLLRRAVARVKLVIFTMSGLIAALAGVLIAARLGAVRASTAEGFELDIITMVLLGGVSIFGGKGSMVGVFLSILIILNLRNGMALLSITGHVQTGVIGTLLIGSVLVPNLIKDWRSRQARA
jgi:rhamnose transport system permease protein